MSKIEEAVVAKIKDRAIDGLIKYQQTMERTDLSRLEWLIHAQEEAMDLAVYLERLIQEFSPKRDRLDGQSFVFGMLVEAADSIGDVKAGMIARVVYRHPLRDIWKIEDSIGRIFWMVPSNLYHVQPKV